MENILHYVCTVSQKKKKKFAHRKIYKKKKKKNMKTALITNIG